MHKTQEDHPKLYLNNTIKEIKALKIVNQAALDSLL